VSTVQVTATTELAGLLEDPGNHLLRKQASQPMPCVSTAEERRLSQRASSQGVRASQSEARPAVQASNTQVFQFHYNFLHFHHCLLAKKPSDKMLVADFGYADAFWRPSAWYLNILVDQQPKPGQEQMENLREISCVNEKFHVRMEKFLLRLEKFHVRMEKLIVCS
jgi:hypothetical protein